MTQNTRPGETAPVEVQSANRASTLAAPGPRGIWLAAQRFAWVFLTALAVGLFVAGIPARFAQLQIAGAADRLALEQLGLSVDGFAAYLIALDAIAVLVHLVIAAVIYWRRADEVIALFVAIALVTNGALVPLSTMYSGAALGDLSWLLANLVIFVGLASGVTLLYVFPDGRFVPRWTLPLALAWAVLAEVGIFLPAAPLSFPRWPLPLQILVLLAIAGVGIYAQVYRYVRVSSPAQRQQAKWAALGLSAAAVGPFVYFVPFVILPSLSRAPLPNFMVQLLGRNIFAVSEFFRLVAWTVLTAGLLLFPLSFAIAILRYRLWDIDILIRRTLIYGALTATLAVIYLGGIVLLQALFRGLTGQQQNALVTVMSTLAIAVLFLPLRARLQRAIDRRFYRRKYDAAQVLAAFAETVRDEVDLGRLTDRLLAVVEETMQPAHVSLWLRPDTARDDEAEIAREATLGRSADQVTR